MKKMPGEDMPSTLANKFKEHFPSFIEMDNKRKIEVQKKPCTHDLNTVRDLVYHKLSKKLQAQTLKQVNSCLNCIYAFDDFLETKIKEKYLDKKNS